MKKYNIPYSWNGLLASGARATIGAHKHEGTVGLYHNSESAITEDTDAGEKAQNERQAALTARGPIIAAQNATREKVVMFLTIVRELLKPKFGVRYSQAWNEVGFINRTLRIPVNGDEQLGLVKMIALFLTAHPELEVPTVATAAIANGLFTTFAADLAAAEASRVTIRETKIARNAAEKALRNRLRSLYAELKHLIPADDPRWLDFGFNVPADVSVPNAPEGFVVTAGLPGHLSPRWEKPVGAVRFRIFRQVIGVDAEAVPVATTRETSLDLGGMTSGAQVKLYVVAANEAGESLPSETVEIVVP